MENKGMKEEHEAVGPAVLSSVQRTRRHEGGTPGTQLLAALRFIVGTNLKASIAGDCLVLIPEVWAWPTDGSVVGRQRCGHNSKKKTLKTHNGGSSVHACADGSTCCVHIVPRKCL